VSAGVAVGTIAAALQSRVMSALLFGVVPLDPATNLAVAVGLAGTALLASYLPAHRASRVDPAAALRWEA
jgi:putative ABC transport system permease protein